MGGVGLGWFGLVWVWLVGWFGLLVRLVGSKLLQTTHGKVVISFRNVQCCKLRPRLGFSWVFEGSSLVRSAVFFVFCFVIWRSR